MKAFIDEPIDVWPGEPGQLKDKIVAAFTLSRNRAWNAWLTVGGIVCG